MIRNVNQNKIRYFRNIMTGTIDIEENWEVIDDFLEEVRLSKTKMEKLLYGIWTPVKQKEE